MKIIGLTGGIASGKSTVARELEKLGAVVINADDVARTVVEVGKPAWKDIADRFGEEILNPDNTINRERLGKVVFTSPEDLKALNEITHPRIMEEIKRQLQAIRGSDPNAIVVLEVPLLYETGMDKICEQVWVVWVDNETQVKRLINRDGLSKEDAMRRIKTQIALDEKARRADIVIDNRFSPEKTREAVARYFNVIRKDS